MMVNQSNEIGWWFSQNLTPSPGGRMAADILFITWRNWCDALKLPHGSVMELHDWLRGAGVILYPGSDNRLYCQDYRHVFPRPVPSRCPSRCPSL